MKIEWLGHASILITTADGTRIVTDPYDGIGIEFPTVEADIVTVSHDHFDHCATEKVGGNPTIVDRTGVHEVRGVRIFGYSTFHDTTGGSERGPNIVFHITADDVRLCHLGDLGHALDADAVAGIGTIDVLFIPVGGTYTIDAAAATDVAAVLRPKIVVPMHYHVPGLSLDIASADAFLADKKDVKRTVALEVTAGSLPDGRETVVLERRV